MVDSSTSYLILTMTAFVLVAIVVVHHHNCSDQIRRKRNEVRSITNQLEKRIDVLEQEIINLKLQIDEVDENLNTMKV